MGRSLVDGGEDTSRLDDVVGAGLAPGDGGGVALAVNGDRLAVDDELAVLGLNRALVATVSLALSAILPRVLYTTNTHRVVLEHVDHVLEVDEGVVDRNNLKVTVLDSVAEHNAADTTWNTSVSCSNSRVEPRGRHGNHDHGDVATASSR